MTTAAAARRYPAYDPVHLLGRVVAREDDGRYRVDCDGRPWRAQRAASCLLAPGVGDDVLISGPDPTRVYLIAVVAQADAGRSRLELPGDVTLESAQGNLSLDSAGTISLRGGAAVRVETDELALHARDVRCVADRLRYVATELQATVGTTRLVGKAYEAVMDRITLMSRLSFRTTEEVEQVRAGTLDYQAEQAARVHANYTMVTGGELVKVDAKQIHMG
ncbi:DUF3540 domain-containing protein [Bordetella genomosp. 11]|uniref:DUF3540 domain-containing protein n=1 Tax=Bordetella genomosp. 11 TaxID=1416808 RepID=A0A261UKB4_9BORD|nr:DUF3540 domain-containing protein [Bordetella genomosp. 11]OZI62326.1 hypothetical protein CAL28_24335 [Bordetella genomosp. 11]